MSIYFWLSMLNQFSVPEKVLLFMNYIQIFNQIFAVTGPVFAMVLVGVILRRIKLIDQPFIQTSSNLVFKTTMPTLFFLAIWKSDLTQAFVPELIIGMTVGSLFAFGLAWWRAAYTVESIDRGVFVQGAFRGNCGVVSFALVASYFGSYGLAAGGVLAGYTILLFNCMAVFILSFYSTQYSFGVRKFAHELATNPLIVSVVLGLLASAVELRMPVWVETSAEYFARITLPLALICVGGTLSLQTLKESGKPAFEASFIKMLLAPAISCTVAWFLGIRGPELIILWMFLSSPTAVGSFAMAMAAGSDGRMAANIIAITTIVSVVTITLGVFALRAMGT